MDDSLVIFCLIAALLWSQILTPSKVRQAQENESGPTAKKTFKGG
jgi:hypothetical protein